MGVLISGLGALSALYPDAKQIFDEEIRRKQIARLIAKVPSIAAYVYRYRRNLPFVPVAWICRELPEHVAHEGGDILHA